MNFLGKLFGAREAINGSAVRAWAEREKRKHKKGEPTFDYLFVYLMACLGHFAQGRPDTRKDRNLPLIDDVEKFFSGDVALFEIGCFMFVAIDAMLFRSIPDRREELSGQFINKYVALFLEMTGINSIPSIFDERVHGYGALIRSNTPMESINQHLTTLILHSKNNRPPESYNFTSPLISGAGFVEAFMIENYLSNWEECSLKAALDMVEGYCKNDPIRVQKAAEHGDAEAQFNLGTMYDDGYGMSGNKSEAAKWYRLAAEQGHAKAQYNLGLLYDEGVGVPQNIAEAVKLYRLAAEQGHAKAQDNLGLMYANGIGVPQNNAAAVNWWRKAAEQGHAKAQYNLGIMYSSGMGVPKNNLEAVKWWRKAAEQGHDMAQFNVGIAYINGVEVPQNTTEATKWLRKAAKQGHANSKKVLKDLGAD